MKAEAVLGFPSNRLFDLADAANPSTDLRIHVQGTTDGKVTNWVHDWDKGFEGKYAGEPIDVVYSANGLKSRTGIKVDLEIFEPFVRNDPGYTGTIDGKPFISLCFFVPKGAFDRFLETPMNFGELMKFAKAMEVSATFARYLPPISFGKREKRVEELRLLNELTEQWVGSYTSSSHFLCQAGFIDGVPFKMISPKPLEDQNEVIGLFGDARITAVVKRGTHNLIEYTGSCGNIKFQETYRALVHANC